MIVHEIDHHASNRQLIKNTKENIKVILGILDTLIIYDPLIKTNSADLDIRTDEKVKELLDDLETQLDALENYIRTEYKHHMFSDEIESLNNVRYAWTRRRISNLRSKMSARKVARDYEEWRTSGPDERINQQLEQMDILSNLITEKEETKDDEIKKETFIKYILKVIIKVAKFIIDIFI